MLERDLANPAKHFASLLPSGGKILITQPDLQNLFESSGLSVERIEASERSLGLLSLPKETYDGVWAFEALNRLNPALCLRTVQNFFAALKPKGLLAISFEESEFPPQEFESMLRQSGFHPLFTGRKADSLQIAIIARRI